MLDKIKERCAELLGCEPEAIMFCYDSFGGDEGDPFFSAWAGLHKEIEFDSFDEFMQAMDS